MRPFTTIFLILFTSWGSVAFGESVACRIANSPAPKKTWITNEKTAIGIYQTFEDPIVCDLLDDHGRKKSERAYVMYEGTGGTFKVLTAMKNFTLSCPWTDKISGKITGADVELFVPSLGVFWSQENSWCFLYGGGFTAGGSVFLKSTFTIVREGKTYFRMQ